MSADMWSLGVVLYILLSGQFPFSEETLFDQIEHAQYSLTGAEWANTSVEAKHFIRSLMTLLPNERLSVKEALQHPWITGAELPKKSPYRFHKTEKPSAKAPAPKETAKRKRTAAPAARKATGVAGNISRKSTGAAAQQQKQLAVQSSQDMGIRVDGRGGGGKATVSKSKSTFEPLNSNNSGVLFWSYRSSLQKHLTQSDASTSKEWSQSSLSNCSTTAAANAKIGIADVSRSSQGGDNNTYGGGGENEGNANFSSNSSSNGIDTPKEMSAAKRRKVSKNLKISPAESSMFGQTKELSDDGIGEFSSDDEECRNDDDGGTNEQPKIERYFAHFGKDDREEEKISSLSVDAMRIESTTGGATAAKSSNNSNSNNSKPKSAATARRSKSSVSKSGTASLSNGGGVGNQKSKNSLEAAWSRQAENIKKSKTIASNLEQQQVDHDDNNKPQVHTYSAGESSSSAGEGVDKSAATTSTKRTSGRTPMKTLSDAFGNRAT